MKINLSQFDSLLFVSRDNVLLNERDKIKIELFPSENKFALYVNGKFIKVDSKSPLEDLVNQTINDFIFIDFKFTSI